MRAFPFLCLALILGVAPIARGENSFTSGRGGPFIEYHTNSLSAFDSSLGGNPIVIGGSGFGSVTKNFRLGGSGGGGFVWSPSGNLNFGMGYGGMVGEYVIASWLSARLLIGGGGYAVAKIISQTNISSTTQTVASGGFVLAYPSLNASIPLHNWITLDLGVGLFLPNVANLQSLALSMALTFGKP